MIIIGIIILILMAFISGYGFNDTIMYIKKDLHGRSISIKFLYILIHFTLSAFILIFCYTWDWFIDLLNLIDKQFYIKFFFKFYFTKQYSNHTEEDLQRIKNKFNYFFKPKIEKKEKLSFSDRLFYKGFELIRKRYNKPENFYTSE